MLYASILVHDQPLIGTAKPLHGHGNVSSRDLTRLFDVGGYR